MFLISFNKICQTLENFKKFHIFQAYLSKLTGEQKKIYDELATIRPKQSIKLNNNDFDDSMNGGGLVMIHGRKVIGHGPMGHTTTGSNG